MIQRYFDFEVYPNWWLCVIGDYHGGTVTEEIKSTFECISSDMPNSRELLLDKITEEGYVVLGYNIKNYDLIIVNAIRNGFEPPQIKLINDMIINPGCAWDSKEHARLSSFAKRPFKMCIYQDLFDDEIGSLKEKEMLLGLSIEECEIPFDKEDLTDEDKTLITEYCKHDVYAAMVYGTTVKASYINAKLILGKTFNIPVGDCYRKTNAQLCAKILDAKRISFADKERRDIIIPAKVREYIYDSLPSNIIERIKNNPDTFSVPLFDNEVSFGNGGLHSVRKNNIYVEEKDGYIIVNMDAEAFYPAMLIKFKLLSRCCRKPELFELFYKERSRIKHLLNISEEDQHKQIAYKLVNNTTFGASGNQFLDLYDPYMCTSCCRVGQLLLASLANNLFKKVPNLQVIQSNTDGVCIYYPKANQHFVDKCTKEFMDVTTINLEYDRITKIWQRDVNNYMWVTDTGKVKTKGAWLNTSVLKEKQVGMSALSTFVCAKAIKEFLLHKKDIMTTIVKTKDISQFVLSCNKGPSYRYVIHDTALGARQVGRCNRVIATTDKTYGGLSKVKHRLGIVSYTKMPGTPDNCLLINDKFEAYNFDLLKKDIDYMWYIMRALALIDMPWYTISNNKLIETNQFIYDFNI